MSSEVKYLYGQQELKNIIALYQSYCTNISQDSITQKQIQQKGQDFLKWINEIIANKTNRKNQIVRRSIEIFKNILKEEIQISGKIIQMEQIYIEKSLAIQNYVQTTKSLESKLRQKEKDIFKLTHEIEQLQVKIEKQELRFKTETKQYRKTFRIIQENNANEKQFFDTVQQQYDHQKEQNQILRNEIQVLKQQNSFLKREIQECKRLLKASQNKVEKQIKKKAPLQNTIKDQKVLIQKLLHEIQDLKESIKNAYQDEIKENEDDKYFEEASHPTKSFQNNLYDDLSHRESFCNIDVDDLVRKNSLRKSFYQIEEPPNIKHSNSNNENGKAIKIQNYDQFKQIRESRKQISPKNKQDQHQTYFDSVIIRDDYLSKTSSQRSKSSSPQIQKFNSQSVLKEKDQEKHNQMSIISQRIQSDASTMAPVRKIVPDLYFAHFLLTSQAVKIKEDCQQMLNIDVKPFYQQIIDKRVPMHIWDQWVRQKLHKNVKQIRQRKQFSKVR